MSDSSYDNNIAMPSSATSNETPTPDTPSSCTSLGLLQPFIDLNEIVIKEKVGHGSYGVVYKAEWCERVVAVKEFGASADKKAIETEVKQLSRVRHNNIIALFGISADQQAKYLIMEYAEGGSLHNFLHGKVKPHYSTAHAMNWARQCAEGVAYLHAMKPKPLIHRDLKPLNLLLTNKGRHLKICDFGTVADKSTLMTNNKGSAAWMAPEVFEGSKYTEKCDIFSWAIVLWEVLSRQQPFKEIDNTYSIMWKIHKGERPPLIKDCPDPIQNLMTSCWATQPDSRPSMQYVVSVMNKLASSFPGAEEPLEYEFVNQQIIRINSIGPDEEGDNYTLDFSSFTSSNNNSTSPQVTPTNSNCHSNTSSSSTPTNSAAGTDYFTPHVNVPTASITATTRWDVIPEEDSETSQKNSENSFNLTPSPATAERYGTIRNGLVQMATVPMAPLHLDIDPNTWDFSHRDDYQHSAKGDGKERLTVTDAKPIMSTDNHNIAITASSPDDLDTETDDENDGTDQSLHEILDPELQPEQPIPNNAESQAIYREHRRLAKEYLRVDTALYYAHDLKEKLLVQIDPNERQEKQELLKKMSEKEELLELYNNLKQQLEKIRADQADSTAITGHLVAPQHQQSQDCCISNTSTVSTPGEIVADDGWVVIGQNENT